MAPTRHHYLIFTIFTFLLGILGMLAFRANEAVPEAIGTEERHDQLVTIVEDLEERRAGLEATLAQLRLETAAEEQDAAAQSGLSRTYAEQLGRLRLLAGLVPVEGPGVTVTLADNPQPPGEGSDPNNFIIHDYDVRIIVNALWSGGAEAVAVNDQRVVAPSAIRCVGTTILVNSTRVGSPFRIQAIGDPVRLEAALERDEDAALLLHDYAKAFGLKLGVSTEDRLSVAAYGGSLAPRNLAPLETEVALEEAAQ